jgi:hypothetical protein
MQYVYNINANFPRQHVRELTTFITKSVYTKTNNRLLAC